jgi:hypothetical protein
MGPTCQKARLIEDPFSSSAEEGANPVTRRFQSQFIVVERKSQRSSLGF